MWSGSRSQWSAEPEAVQPALLDHHPHLRGGRPCRLPSSPPRLRNLSCWVQVLSSGSKNIFIWLNSRRGRICLLRNITISSNSNVTNSGELVLKEEGGNQDRFRLILLVFDMLLLLFIWHFYTKVLSLDIINRCLISKLSRNAGSCAVTAHWEGWAASGVTEEMCSLWSRRWPGFSSGASQASQTSASSISSSPTRRSGPVRPYSGFGISKAPRLMKFFTFWFHLLSQSQLTKPLQVLAST